MAKTVCDLMRFSFRKRFLKRFNVQPMKWQERVLIKHMFLSENVCPISIYLSESVLMRLANMHRLQKTLSIGLEIGRNVFEKNLKPVFLVK